MDEWVEARDLHGRLICLVNITTGEVHIRKAGRDYLIAVKNGIVMTTLIEKEAREHLATARSAAATNAVQPERSGKDGYLRPSHGRHLEPRSQVQF